MIEFNYIAADKEGKKVEGRRQAANEGELRMMLRGQGLRPIKISKASISEIDIGVQIMEWLGMGGTVPTEKLMNFIKQLQVMITSGVPLVQALELFHDQESHPTLKRILAVSREKIQAGNFLWESLSAYPEVFERVFVSLIRAGESSGNLDTMLMRCGKYLENSYRMKKLLKGAMVYPISVLVIAAAVVTLMLVAVIPKFEEMIASNGGELPWATQVVISLSHFMVDNFIYIAVSAGIIGYLFRLYAKSTEGRIVLQRISIRLPVFGDLIKKSGVARFTRTMSTLLSSGVPMIDSLEICKGAADNVVFEEAINTMKREIEMGSSVAMSMFKQSVFPKMATQMVSVGENTGNMDKMMERVADFYEEEVQNAIQSAMKLIEPVMLVLLGGIVGGLMISMYLPIFQMAGGAK